MNSINSTNTSFRGISGFITSMTKADAMKPIVALEATVVAGRTYQAYKRGKWDEARERFIEESMGSIVWLCGVKSLNALGDKVVDRILKAGGNSFDVGTDKILRTPFDNFMRKIAPKGFTGKQVAMIKSAKVLTSIILANLFIGFVVPKLNHALTNKVMHERKIEKEKQKQLENEKQSENTKGLIYDATAFKASPIGAINAFTNLIENTNTGQLLSSDFGIAGGRMYNARSKEERREIAIRDLGSIYFYMWARGHISDIMNLVESGNTKRLNPSSAQTLNEYLKGYLRTQRGEMSVADFKQRVLGKSDSEVSIPEGIKFETEELSWFSKILNKKPLEVAKVSEVEKYITEPHILDRINAMSAIQPKKLGEAVITKKQLIDALNDVVINDAKLLHEVFNEFTEGKYKDEFKYVSNNKLYNLKQEMVDYVEHLCKYAKDGKITEEILDKYNKRNIRYCGLNFVTGFIISALFISTLIPKFQYYVTRKTTGVDAFPGTYDYEKHKEIEV